MSDAELRNSPSEDAIVVATISKLQKATTDAASAQGELRAAFSKAEGDGINLNAAKAALKVLKKGEEAAKALVEDMTKTIRYLHLCGVELTKEQLELFSFTDTSSAPIDERAYEAGLAAGRMGHNQDDNKHGIDTSAGQKWLEGWHKGAEERRQVYAMQPKDQDGSELVKTENDLEGQTDAFDAALQQEGDD